MLRFEEADPLPVPWFASISQPKPSSVTVHHIVALLCDELEDLEET